VNEEELFRRAFDDAAIGMSLLAVEPLGQYLEVNPAFCRMTGYSREELLSRDFQSITASQDLEDNLTKLNNLLTGTTPFLRIEKQYVRKDDSTFWARLHISLVRDRKKPLYIIVQIEDITDRKRAEERLRFSHFSIEHVVDGAFWITPDARFFDVNESACRSLGYTREELLSMSVFDIDPDFSRDDWSKAWKELKRRRSLTLETRHRTKSGKVFPVEITANYLEYQGREYNCAFARDISDRKRAEQALRESSQFNEQVIANAREGVIVYDRELRYVVWNRFMEETTGLRSEEVLGKKPTDLAALLQDHGRMIVTQEGMNGIYASANKALVGETFTYYDIPWTLKDGTTGWNSARWCPFRDTEGKIIGVIATVQDITERKRMEEQLRHAHKLEAIGQIAGGIAHEFNNLLTAIIGNLDLIKKKMTMETELLSLLNQSDQAAHRAATLTQQLLAFARKSQVNLQPQNLHIIAEDVAHLLRQTIDRRIPILVESVDDLRPILADTDQMNQVIMNLCLNARDAITKRFEGMDPKDSRGWQPHIHVKTENVYADEAFCRFHPDAKPGDYISLCVCDNGCGIEKGIQHRIFEPFFTTKELGQGTGLGLATVYGIVKQHDGWIELDTKRKDATAFMAYLPCTDQPLVPKARHTGREMETKGTETILLVDDEPAIRRLGQTILEHHGYTVLLAEDGQEALEVYRRKGKRIQLVILDLTMPRQSGQEVLLELRRMDPTVKVIVSSGHHNGRIIKELRNVNKVEFIPKPYRPNELARKVRNVLDQKDDL
jgi:two-component system, cell cycle sensor histidine kinase and response regulator CckA